MILELHFSLAVQQDLTEANGAVVTAPVIQDMTHALLRVQDGCGGYVWA